jgi:hypothetical protein
MSVSSTEVEDQFSDFTEDDGKSSVAQDDDADVHNSTATIGDVVPAYRFMSWLDGDDPDALSMEDRFFLRQKVDLSYDEEEVDEFSSQSYESNPADHFKFAPLSISGHATDGQDSVPEYIHHYQSAKFKDIEVDASLHDAQEELMHHIKKHSYPPGLVDDVHEWAKKWLNLGYKFESAKAKTVMNQMIAKYEPFTAPPPKTIYRRLGDHLPPSPISYWDIASQIRCTLANPEAAANATWKFSKKIDPVTAQRVYGEFSGCEWWEEADASVSEILQDRHYVCPVSIFIDGAHLNNLGRMCVEPVIMELLALSIKVRWTDISKIILGFLPPYPLLTAKKNEEAKSKKTKHNHLAFYHKALNIVLNYLLYLEGWPSR